MSSNTQMILEVVSDLTLKHNPSADTRLKTAAHLIASTVPPAILGV